MKVITKYDVKNQSNVVKINKEFKTIINTGYKDLTKVIKENVTEDAYKNYSKSLNVMQNKIKKDLDYSTISKLDKNTVTKELNKIIGNRTLDQRMKLGANNLFKNCTNELRKDILQGIEKSISKGESIDKMTKTIKQQLDTDTYKARRIARTESHRMNEFSNREAIDQMQEIVDLKIEWLATKGNRTREDHRHLDGKFADKEGYFHIGIMKTKYPGGFGYAREDIHCRCTILANFDNL